MFFVAFKYANCLMLVTGALFFSLNGNLNLKPLR